MKPALIVGLILLLYLALSRDARASVRQVLTLQADAPVLDLGDDAPIAAGEGSGDLASSLGGASAAADYVSDAVGLVFSAGQALLDDVGEETRRIFQLPAAAAPYADAIAAAEVLNGLPEGTLGAVLYQESRFRPDIISGETVSKAGAIGIAQIVPRWHPNVDPRDPDASIAYAGRFLKQMFNRFGNWTDALAAYNWGEGNVSAWLATGKGIKGQERPEENINYVRDITALAGIS